MFIQDHSCLSPQVTYDDSFFKGEIKSYVGNKYFAIEPNYSELIPRGLLRRMGKAVRMGVGTGIPLLSGRSDVDGIILGTAMGGLEDCVKFLNQIVDYDEGTLTPTNFVQSTPNSIAGNLALMNKNTGYNNTHIGLGLAFESALLDAQLLFSANGANTLLLGSVEETSSYNYNIDYRAGHFKEVEVSSEELLTSNTKGTVRGEGAAMFIVSKDRRDALCEVVDVGQHTYLEKEDTVSRIEHFLKDNGMTKENIDTLVLGFSGDNRSDYRYQDLATSFSESTVYSYKNLVGEYPSVSAFAMWLSVNLIESKHVPKEALYRKGSDEVNNVLIYNHYNDVQHGFMLLSRTD